MYKSGHWDLFWKKRVLRCVFAGEFQVFWIVQHELRIRNTVESGDKLGKLSVLLRIYLFAWGIALFWIWSSGQTRNTLAKLRILVKIYLFPWHSEVLLCVTVDFQGQLWCFFSLNKLTSRYSQWAGKSKLPDK